jgi:adenylate cyclase
MNDTSPAYLEAEIGGQNRRFELVNDRVLRIGRSDKNNVVIDDDLTSRQHAILQRSADESYFCITDLGSSNGTYVNGTRVWSPVILRPGDRIRIGNQEFRFQQDIHVEPPSVEVSSELRSTNILLTPSFVTVLVADVRDFTGLGRRIDASKLSRVSGMLFRKAGKLLHERGAWAQKYMGDAIMAVWLHEKGTLEVHDLIAIFDGLLQLTGVAAGLQAQFKLDSPILVGACINSGWASIGNVGSVASSDYTALGDVVNKTFRLESATKEMSCDLALGQETYDFLAVSIEVATLFQSCTVKLKGYEDPATVYASHLSALPTVLEALRQS